MMNAQLFYKDDTNIIYSLYSQEAGRYFLNIPVSQYQNFMSFLNLKKELSSIKGEINDGQ